MKKLIAVAALGLPLMASAQLQNSSFESGLSNWIASGGGSGVSSLNYATQKAYGETVTPNAAITQGTAGVYFFDDSATQTLSQTANLAAGLYNWSVSYYLPSNGIVHPNASDVSLSVGGSSVWAQSIAAPAGWFSASGQVNLAGGNTAVTFTFDPQGSGLARDIVLDSVSVSVVPEPESFALMAAGLAALGFLARRRRA